MKLFEFINKSWEHANYVSFHSILLYIISALIHAMVLLFSITFFIAWTFPEINGAIIRGFILIALLVSYPYITYYRYLKKEKKC